MEMRVRLLASWLGFAAILALTGCSPSARAQENPAAAMFATADNCLACHNGLTTSKGEDFSFGKAWRASMMANSARDPYWQAAVRRETIDHPKAADAIEDECAICHMPMARTTAAAMGEPGQIFAHLPLGEMGTHQAQLAADGVSCTVCHQITPKGLGTRQSFSGRFIVDTTKPFGERPLFGPFPVERGRTRIMHSATGFRPEQSDHIRQSELCATCHTLYTTALGPDGKKIGEFPEQVPYLEWRHSDFVKQLSCLSCHMPAVEETSRMSSVLGEPRDGIGRHDFRGGNFFMLEMLNRYRADLAVQAEPAELDQAARTAVEHLQTAATLELRIERRSGTQLPIEVTVTNLTGHKLPTAYPSRRAWIHLIVRDSSKRALFESGAMTPNGAIRGNDNDDDAARFESHHRTITSVDQVQIYEPILMDAGNRVTTGLLSAVRYAKDNRLLPRGFDKRTAQPDIAVYGEAVKDADFIGDGDRVRYLVPLPEGTGAVTVEAALMFQPIGFRWAQNLRGYDADEPRRFAKYYDSMSSSSAQALARAKAIESLAAEADRIVPRHD